jgi:hypothetical protein
MISEILKSEWTDFFNAVGKKYADWQTKVEMMGNDIGAQILFPDGLPFSGVVEYKTNKINAIHIILGEKTNARRTRTIFSPQNVFFETIEDDPGGIIGIEDKRGGKTLVYLKQPMPVLAAYPKRETLAVGQ